MFPLGTDERERTKYPAELWKRMQTEFRHVQTVRGIRMRLKARSLCSRIALLSTRKGKNHPPDIITWMCGVKSPTHLFLFNHECSLIHTKVGGRVNGRNVKSISTKLGDRRPDERTNECMSLPQSQEVLFRSAIHSEFSIVHITHKYKVVMRGEW